MGTKPTTKNGATQATPTPIGNGRSQLTRLGDVEVLIVPLRTGTAMKTAKQLLGYINLIRNKWDSLMTAYNAPEGEAGSEPRISAAFEIVEAMMNVLEEDELTKFLANLIGQPLEVVEDAPLADTLEAVAVSFEVNDMPALIKAAARVVQAASGMMRGDDTPAPAATPPNRAERRAAVTRR